MSPYDPAASSDAPRAGGETPTLLGAERVEMLRKALILGRMREPYYSSSIVVTADELEALLNAWSSLLERHRDGERWRGLVALLDRESMRTPEPGTLILWTMRSTQWDAPIASIQSIAWRAPSRTMWIEEAETINEAMDRVLAGPSPERASK